MNCLWYFQIEGNIKTLVISLRSSAEISSVRREIIYEFPFGINYAWMLLIFALTVSYSGIRNNVLSVGSFFVRIFFRYKILQNVTLANVSWFFIIIICFSSWKSNFICKKTAQNDPETMLNINPVLKSRNFIEFFLKYILNVFCILYLIFWTYSASYMYPLCILYVSYIVICPLITPFGLFYMIMKHGTDRYNIYFAYKRSKINKVTFNPSHLRSFCCMSINTFFLIYIIYCKDSWLICS